MTGWKKHRQDELWTQQLFFAIFAPGARGALNRGWWNEGGGGLWDALEVTRLDGLFAANLSDSKAHGLPSSSLKSVFPPEGQGAVGQSLSCKGMALANQPPSVFSSAAARHVKQQLLESLVHFGSTSAALAVRSLCLCSTHCFSASYVLIQSNIHFWSNLNFPLTASFELTQQHFNSKQHISNNSVIVLTLNLNLKRQ